MGSCLRVYTPHTDTGTQMHVLKNNNILRYLLLTFISLCFDGLPLKSTVAQMSLWCIDGSCQNDP